MARSMIDELIDSARPCPWIAGVCHWLHAHGNREGKPRKPRATGKGFEAGTLRRQRQTCSDAVSNEQLFRHD